MNDLNTTLEALKPCICGDPACTRGATKPSAETLAAMQETRAILNERKRSFTIEAMLEGGGLVKQLQAALRGDALAASQLTIRLATIENASNDSAESKNAPSTATATEVQ